MLKQSPDSVVRPRHNVKVCLRYLSCSPVEAATRVQIPVRAFKPKRDLNTVSQCVK